MSKYATSLLLIVSLASFSSAAESKLVYALKEVIGEGKEHKLMQYGEEFGNYIGDTRIGYNADLNFDLGIGYKAPLYSEGDMATFNPQAYVQFGGTQNITLSFQVIDISFLFDVVLYRYTFFDFLANLDTIDWKEVCTAMTWESKTIDISMRTHINQKECIWGILGMFIDDADVEDCQWMEYHLEKEWFHIPLMEDYNMEGEYQPYMCKTQNEMMNIVEPE